jgi:hypothetical protein
MLQTKKRSIGVRLYEKETFRSGGGAGDEPLILHLKKFEDPSCHLLFKAQIWGNLCANGG